MIISTKFYDIIYSSILEVQGGFFAGEKIWKELGTNKKELDFLFEKVRSIKKTNGLLNINKKDFKLILTLIEKTIEELGEEEFSTITGISYKDAKKLYIELSRY